MVRILTDSSTGLTLDFAKKHGIEMVFMPISFDGEEYLDILELSSENFYKKLVAAVATGKGLPKTSAIAQATFEEIFNDVKNKGDEMVVLTISQGLSSTFGQADKAIDTVGYDKIYNVNSLATVAGLIALVMEAVKMRDSGKSGAEIAQELDRLVPKIKLFAYVDTFKYLCAGGRVAKAVAIVGNILNIKPGITMEGGALFSRQKYVGVKKAQASIVSQLSANDFDDTKPVYFNHSIAPHECKLIEKMAKTLHPDLINGGSFVVSSTVGTHVGPAACAIIFFEK